MVRRLTWLMAENGRAAGELHQKAGMQPDERNLLLVGRNVIFLDEEQRGGDIAAASSNHEKDASLKDVELGDVESDLLHHTPTLPYAAPPGVNL